MLPEHQHTDQTNPCVFVINSSRIKISNTGAPRWALPVHAFVPSEFGLAFAAPFRRRNSLRGIQQLWLCCFGPWGYVAPVWWLILLPFSFLPVGSTTPGKNTQQRPHNCTLADFLENELPFQVLLCQLRAANDPFPAQSMETCAEHCDVCREGSEAPVV